MQEQTIKTKLEELPEELKKEVLDYIDFLLQKHRKRKKGGDSASIGRVAYRSSEANTPL